MNDIRALTKFINEVCVYFDNRRSCPIAAAERLSNLPDSVQEYIFEMCVNYIRSVAERKEFYPDSGNMPHYHDIAKSMMK